MAKPIPLLFLKAGFPPAKPADDREMPSQPEAKPEPEPDVKPEPKPKAPQVGDLVKFTAGDFVGKGKVVAVGEDGLTIADGTGREHGIHWDELTGIKRQAAEESKADDEAGARADESAPPDKPEPS